MKLTDEQRRVVDGGEGRLRVVGGAGSGKTTALLARYRRLVAGADPPVGGRERGGGERGGGGALPSSVLVLCRSRAAAGRFRDTVLPVLVDGFDAVPITTFFGLAFDLVSRHDGPVTLLTGAEQRHLVGRLLAAEDPGDWPTLGHLLGRAALVGEVADGLLLLPGSHQPGGPDGSQRPGWPDGPDRLGGPDGSHPPGVRGGADEPNRPGGPPPWPELAAFAGRYRRVLATEGRIDGSDLLARAADLLADPAVGAAERGRIEHILVDDLEAATPAMATMLDRLAGADVVVAGDPDGSVGGFPGADRRHLAAFTADTEVDLGRGLFRNPDPPVLVCTRHPSLEPEAVAGELLASRAAGVAWSDMAVLVRRPRHRARAIARALSRHGIPARAPAFAVVADDPVVGSVVDMLRWADGDAAALDRLLVSPLSDLDAVEARRVRRRARLAGTPLDADPRLADLVALRHDLVAGVATETPAELAFRIWQRSLGHLVTPDPDADGGRGGADDVLDGLVAFLDALSREAERNPRHRLSDVLAILDDDGQHSGARWPSIRGGSTRRPPPGRAPRRSRSPRSCRPRAGNGTPSWSPAASKASCRR